MGRCIQLVRVSVLTALMTFLRCGGGDPEDGSAVRDASDRRDAAGAESTQPVSANIVVDQFGYRTEAEKIAVVRSPVEGFDSAAPFTPSATYALIDARSGAKVFEARPTPWNDGAVDPSSGDRAWWFDFSVITAPGEYVVVDESAGARSDVFRIDDDVYQEVLVQAVRVLYYQRDGIAKEAKFAGAEWSDGPAHLGAGQGPDCTLYQGTTKKDVRGGWWDAGDQNKYTNWGASDVVQLLRAYSENPRAFTDDTNIPESGNGVADVLDETKWELDWLARMQNDDGSVLSIVAQDGAKEPAFGGSKNTAPSTATGPCTFGPATTSASYSAAAAFAHAAIVFVRAPGVSAAYPGFTADLSARAAKAWTWANANVSVAFQNGGKIGGGEQEVDDAGRRLKRLQAAVFLFELTGDTAYRAAFDEAYTAAPLIATGAVDVYAMESLDALLEYTLLPGATPAIAADVRARYKAGLEGYHNMGSVIANRDPYLGYLQSYSWGSNQLKGDQGTLFTNMVVFAVDPTSNAASLHAAERYIHSLHGLNPLGLVYLSNMGAFGAHKSVTRFYHTWFAKGSHWDAVGVSLHGPPPGYLVGGPNPTYTWDACCPDACSGFRCGATVLAPPAGQPSQKAYLDFNDGWPLDSWSVSEPDDGYQIKYIRLLSKFVGTR